jgi:hypothetical protein
MPLMNAQRLMAFMQDIAAGTIGHDFMVFIIPFVDHPRKIIPPAGLTEQVIPFGDFEMPRLSIFLGLNSVFFAHGEFVCNGQGISSGQATAVRAPVLFSAGRVGCFD